MCLYGTWLLLQNVTTIPCLLYLLYFCSHAHIIIHVDICGARTENI